jgi:hypothetical protein
MFGTMASTILTLSVVGGALILVGVLEGALEVERARAYEGRQDKDLMSQLQGGNLAPRYYYPDVLGVDVCFSFWFRLSPP